MTKHRIYIQSHIIGTEADSYENKSNYERSLDDPLLDDPAYPKLMFVENLYNGDVTNWWILPNATSPGNWKHAGTQHWSALCRSSGALRIWTLPPRHGQKWIAMP